MKKLNFLIPAILLGVLMVVASCEEDEKETCKQAEICAAKAVTSCCTDDVCVYKYNGKEYAESEVEQLALDLGCGTASAQLKSSDINQLISKLEALMQDVKATCNCGN
ncbi:MAG: hypothetical protein MI922_23145 [Bacteroidales bacterium]|nr:hypothetical protein [Bacteroidales bacterium]